MEIAGGDEQPDDGRARRWARRPARDAEAAGGKPRARGTTWPVLGSGNLGLIYLMESSTG